MRSIVPLGAPDRLDATIALFTAMPGKYVCPAGGGQRVGQALIAAITDLAERIGFREMRLDRLPSMAAALRLYCAAGCKLIRAYDEAPVTGMVFLGRGVGGT